MTQDDPNPTPGANDFVARYIEHERRTAALIPFNKEAVFEALKEAGITTVAVRFDGYGDSGQIEEVVAKADDAEIAIPEIQVYMSRVQFGTEEIERQPQPLPQAIETMVYALLETTHGGWENNEGAYGDFKFDVGADLITLEFNYRIEAVDTHFHDF
jgi:hypothetical protein